MIEIGKKLVCKKSSVLHDPWPIIIKKGEVYVITDITNISIIINIVSPRNGNIIYDNYYSFSKNRGKYKDYIWDFFYSPAEWRDKQINSILND